MKTIIVTRHKGTVEWIKENYPEFNSAEVMESVTEDDVGNNIVIGVLPIGLAALCHRYLAVEFPVGNEPRGQELSSDEINKRSAKLVEYRIVRIGEYESKKRKKPVISCNAYSGNSVIPIRFEFDEDKLKEFLSRQHNAELVEIDPETLTAWLTDRFEFFDEFRDYIEDKCYWRIPKYPVKNIEQLKAFVNFTYATNKLTVLYNELYDTGFDIHELVMW